MEDYYKIQKQGVCELLLPENVFKTSSTLRFPKKYPDFGDLETSQLHETETRFFLFALLHMS